MTTLDWILAAIAHFGYLALFAAAVVEGPIATVIGGFLVSRGLLDVIPVYAVVVAGDLAGDLLCYGIGRSGQIALHRWRREWLVHRQRELAILGNRLRAHAGRTLLFGKLTHAPGFLILVAAGAARIPVATFVWYNLLGTLPKAALFLAIGYFAGSAYNRINSYMGAISLLVLLLVCFCAAIVLRRRQFLCEPER